uniref:Uracil phosphoribosyltransferase n=1 Tax=Liagora brachyclada TaxID=1884665 RepID=A0A1G4P0H2_9FLOR|nr:Uracil phosphoribosyltransferase [Liagora brachyclada]SCW24306.1 Uracil phosphoribosyltransferase [Liagora brachyclada]
MGINIYTIKHPLVLNWMNYLTHNNIPTNDRYELIHKISLALLYEACRKVLQNNTLYIKYINQVNEIWLTDNSPIDIFFSNINILQIAGKDIRNMIPNLNMHFIDLKNNTNNQHSISNNRKNSSTEKINSIIIVEEQLQSQRIISTLEKIYEKQQKYNNIQICCCYCNTTELDNLSQKYSNLDIYTGQITDNKIFNYQSSD